MLHHIRVTESTIDFFFCRNPATSPRPSFRDLVLTLVGNQQLVLSIPQDAIIRDSPACRSAGSSTRGWREHVPGPTVHLCESRQH